MELHEIRYFLTLSRTLNFTRAAESCHVTQPALTRAIQKMEGELGGALLSRGRNKIRLTELGRRIEPHLAKTLAHAEAAKDTAMQMTRPGTRPLEIGVMATIGPVLFIDFLSRLRALHPEIRVNLTEAPSLRLCRLLQDQKLDAALVSRPDGFASDLQPQPLYHERFVVACASAHPMVRRNAVRVVELDGQPFLPSAEPEHEDVLNRILVAHGVHLQHCFRGEGDAWRLAMVAAGMGICLLSQYARPVPGVECRPVIDPMLEREVCLVTATARPRQAPLTRFVDAARDHCRPKPQPLRA